MNCLYVFGMRPWLGLLWVGLLLLFSGAAEANPALEGYARYDAFVEELRQIAQSDRATLSSLAKTRQGRDVWLLTLSTGEPHSKPAVLLVGNVQASHLLGSELATRIARQLLEPAADDEAAAKLLDQYTFYIIPRPNPDGTERNFEPPFYESNGNARPTDDDRDFRTDEDPPEDLNGDGWITLMRVEDAAGESMPHPDEPRVMITADAAKNERGRYRLFTEGRDNDQDDEFNEDGPGGVDFNRNFTFRYPYFKPGAGPHAVSEAETRAVADFAFDRANIAVVFSFSPHDNLFHPWKPDANSEKQRIKTHVLGDDAGYLNFLAEKYRQAHGGKEPPEPAKGEGAFSEWAYFHYGRWSLSARGWWIPQVAVPDGEKTDEKRGADQRNQLRWLAEQDIPFVDWQPIEHPDFPDQSVEIGGIPPFYALNPPADQLDDLAGRHAGFLQELVTLLPRLELAAQVEPLGGGLFRVTATVRNPGYLPTFAKMGAISEQVYPPQLSIQLPEGAKLVHGSTRTALERLAGSGGSAEHVWLVRRQGEATAASIRVAAPAIGQAQQEIELK